jgi:hypothetical protein
MRHRQDSGDLSVAEEPEGVTVQPLPSALGHLRGDGSVFVIDLPSHKVEVGVAGPRGQSRPA